MKTPPWEYARENVLDLDKDKGKGWSVMGKYGWELVTIYTAHETCRPVPIIAVFKRKRIGRRGK
jgi:hypothetical protein